jgi:2-polyprenyl-3-methyl-5-hydroxy-6-metoxy-1,4-benzoquinol methylase
MKFRLSQDTLDQFIRETDRLGPGTPGCNVFWEDLVYEPTISLDAQLKPRSAAYKEQQLGLYHEIVGHDYLVSRDEHSPNIPVDRLLYAPNAYNHQNPADFVKHYVAMSMLVQELRLPIGARILELGSGWGFTQEFLATCGYDTVGIEMNDDFVTASNARLRRLGFGERVRRGTFESFDLTKEERFDAVIAYEAFHHAVDPEAMLGKYISHLKPGGYFALAAEPFNRYYHTWGLRLDACSIYSIKKFGWFESGWSVEYMAYLLNRCGMEANFIEASANELTRYMIGWLSDRRRPYQLGLWDPSIGAGWWTAWDYCGSRGKSSLLLARPPNAKTLKIDTANFNTSPLNVSVALSHGKEHRFLLQPGDAEVVIEIELARGDGEDMRLELTSDTFCPAKVGINADPRDLGIHIRSIQWE